MSRVMKVVFLSLICSLIVAVPSLRALWIADGVPVCTATGPQSNPQVASDGAGGAIITWQDYRGGDGDIYSQKINPIGMVQWDTDGLPLCTATGAQDSPTITSDGAGGAIVAWHEGRTGDWDIYAQRIDASGVVHWTTDGVPVCTAATNQDYLHITTDGAGGAIVTWRDLRNGTFDIYAQRIGALGTVQWATDGIPVRISTSHQFYPRIISDGSGGAIVTWKFESHNYAQRINASGTLLWTVNGVRISTYAAYQGNAEMTSDGAGGAIITWYDIGGASWDIYAQRIDASGTVQWATGGVPICTATGNQSYPLVTSDGVGGAIITGPDPRSGNNDIYAQRINASGTVQWTVDGVPLCTATGNQEAPHIRSDGAGGARITWHDSRSGNWDIYTQRVKSSGTVHWTINGVPLCTATGDQLWPPLTFDGVGGAIVTWYDYRSGTNYDIYAQQIDSQGRISYHPPVIHSVSDIPGDEGGYVNLTWNASPLDYFSSDITEYTVWRALDTPAALSLQSSGVSIVSSPAAALEGTSAGGGESILRLASLNGEILYWKLISTLTAYHLQGYSEIAATVFDSTAVCDDYHYFQVIAHTSDPMVFYISEPDSGYSVDNLAPAAPLGLAGEQLFTPEGLQMTWNPNSEADLAEYNIYRGIGSDFMPGPGNFVTSTPDTAAFDGDWSWDAGYWYKVAAVDIHGNESAFAVLGPDMVTGDDPMPVPDATFLTQNFPNPFNPATTIEFGLERPSRISLQVYDAAGRLVRIIADEERPAGHYSEVWDGKDGSGRAVSSGVYFYRLDTGSFTRTRKMILLK